MKKPKPPQEVFDAVGMAVETLIIKYLSPPFNNDAERVEAMLRALVGQVAHITICAAVANSLDPSVKNLSVIGQCKLMQKLSDKIGEAVTAAFRNPLAQQQEQPPDATGEETE